MRKFLAIYPLEYGDECHRRYKTAGAAIGQAKRHLTICKAQGLMALRAEVYEVQNGKRTLIWEEWR